MKTVVDFIKFELESFGDPGHCKLTWDELDDILNRAKEMEKEQIIAAHIEGFYSPPFRKSRRGEAEDYYDKIFKEE